MDRILTWKNDWARQGQEGPVAKIDPAVGFRVVCRLHSHKSQNQKMGERFVSISITSTFDFCIRLYSIFAIWVYFISIFLSIYLWKTTRNLSISLSICYIVMGNAMYFPPS